MDKNRSIKFDWNQEQFQQKANKLIKDLSKQSDTIINKLATDYVGSAVTHTPPSLGKRAIEKKFWTRPILSLNSLIRKYYKNYKPNADDYKAFHLGMKYKVLNTKKGVQKGMAYAYCKTKAQAKAAAKIETRGLARVMWGKNLGTIGSMVPTSILKIFNKSPKLNALNYNKIIKEKTGTQVSVQIENSANSVNRTKLEKAVIFADRKVENTLQRLLKDKLDKEKNL